MPKVQDFSYLLNQMVNQITKDGVFDMYPEFAVEIRITPQDVTLAFVDENNRVNTKTISRNLVPDYEDIKTQVLAFFQAR